MTTTAGLVIDKLSALQTPKQQQTMRVSGGSLQVSVQNATLAVTKR